MYNKQGGASFLINNIVKIGCKALNYQCCVMSIEIILCCLYTALQPYNLIVVVDYTDV